MDYQNAIITIITTTTKIIINFINNIKIIIKESFHIALAIAFPFKV